MAMPYEEKDKLADLHCSVSSAAQDLVQVDIIGDAPDRNLIEFGVRLQKVTQEVLKLWKFQRELH